MSEQAQTSTGRTRPEIRGKVIAVLDEWRNNAGTFWKRETLPRGSRHHGFPACTAPVQAPEASGSLGLEVRITYFRCARATKYTLPSQRPP
jgi:hypothetical protein